MNYFLIIISFFIAPFHLLADVEVDLEHLGKSLGGWKYEKKRAAEYEFSGSRYRTYKPEFTKNPDGGIFVSIRIDHVRGWLSSDDHAVLEVTISPQGQIASAQSNIAIQGRTISSELIRNTAAAGKEIAGPVIDKGIQVGSDLIADLTSKLLREKIVEAGRVSFPSIIRHNYNYLYQAIKTTSTEPRAASVVSAPLETKENQELKPPVLPSNPAPQAEPKP